MNTFTPKNIDSKAQVTLTTDGRFDNASLWRRAVTFLRAFARHALAGFPTVNPLVKRKRMSICRACPQFDAAKESCRKCGCRLKVKTAWALERCPESKW